MPNDWIHTFSSKAFTPARPRLEDFDIIDIARALSMQCRYVGHVTKFYSVAEHSVRVSRRVEELVESLNWTEATKLEAIKWALIHDASEAYLGDISHPLKQEPLLAGYRLLETRMMALLAPWLGLEPLEPAIVTTVDKEIIGTEARQLKGRVHPDWDLPPPFPGVHVLGWTPAVAERNFLQRFRRLWGNIGDYTDKLILERAQ